MCTSLLVVAIVVLFAVPAQAQSEAISVTRGEPFTVERPRQSSFQRWSIDQFDARVLALEETTIADTVGTDRFRFQALETGETTIDLVLEHSTVLGNQTASTATITVQVQEPGAAPGVDSETASQDTSGAPTITDQTEQRLQDDDGGADASGGTSNGPSAPDAPSPGSGETTRPANVDSQRWDQAQELVETGRFEAARELIQQQAEEARGPAKQQWQNLLAESYMENDEFEQAAGVWEGMVEEFSRGPVGEWKYNAARAYRQADMADQAELLLMEIRHRHRDSGSWTNAMVELGELAIDQGNYDRARTILETARKPLENRDNPRLVLRLARMYDEFKPVRNYERAARLYEQAGEALRNSDPEASQEALDRAEYLREQYVNFGF